MISEKYLLSSQICFFITQKDLLKRNMKKKISFIFLFALLVIVVSLILLRVKGSRVNERLTAIDSIAVNDPERALAELNLLNIKRFRDNELAYHTIIKSQVQMDLGNMSVNDSLLSAAIFTFLGSDDSTKISRSYYLRGKYLLNEGDVLEAASSLMYAADYMSQDLDNKSKFEIYKTLSDIFHKNKLYKQELEGREKAYNYAVLYGDSIAINKSRIDLSRCYSSSATFSDDIIVRVLKMIYSLPDSDPNGLPDFVRKISDLEEYENQLTVAISYIDSALISNKDTIKQLSYLRVKGELLCLFGKHQEAIQCFEKAVESPINNDRIVSYKGLYNLYKERSQDDKAFYYVDRLIDLQDSIRRDWADGSFIRLSSIQAYKKQRRAYVENKIDFYQAKTTLATISVGFLITSLILLVFLVIYKTRQSRLQMSVEEEKNKLIQIELEKRNIENELLREQAEKETERLKTLAADLSRKEAENELLKEKTEKEALLAKDMLIKAEYYKRLNLISIPILSAKKDKKGFIFLGSKDWDIIKNNTNACFENFTDRLKNRFSYLTEDDIHFLCLIKMELSLDLLASVYHVEKNSISKKKGRMREKLKIQDKSLDDFIRSF